MEKILLLSHAAAGVLTLLTGIAAMSFPKKLKVHKPAGKVFYYAMWYVLITAFILSVLKSNIFLFLVGILVFNSNTMGLRCLRLYQSKAPSVSWKEWAIWTVSIVLLFTCQFFIISKYGFRFDGEFIVVNIFSIILLIGLLQDLKLLVKNNYTKKQYLVGHIGKIGGAFIGAITAAMVQNVQSDPIWIVWLLPTAIFSPVIAYYSRSVRNGSFWKTRKGNITASN